LTSSKSDYFPGITPGKTYLQSQTRITETVSGNFYVNECCLQYFNNSAVYVSLSSTIRLVIENSHISDSHPVDNYGGGSFLTALLVILFLPRVLGLNAHQMKAILLMFYVEVVNIVHLFIARLQNAF